MKVAIAGPAAAGKGAISRRLAKHLGLTFVDSGLVFRAIASAWRESTNGELRLPSAKELRFLNERVDYVWSRGEARVLLSGIDVTAALGADHIARYTAFLSSDAKVLQQLCANVDQLAHHYDAVICDGRSAGTSILADANHRIFITAALDVRAQRRWKQLLTMGENVSLLDIFDSIRARDQLDEPRLTPILQDSSWLIVDTSGEDVDQSVERVLAHIIPRA